MSRSTSHNPSAHSRGAHGGGSHDDSGSGGGGGGGGGKLVKVAFARNQAEAEMIQGLLLEGDIPSVLKRSRGFDAPEFMAAGPHDVFVDSSHAEPARTLLADTITENETDEEAELREEARLRHGGPTTETSPARLAIWVGAAFLGAVILVWVLYQLS
ncbi:MAG: zinc ribbon protein [Solirubrobacterales bacterium]|nr:zinc ribbon protein [Solirubrobacterales bacterium]